ncbi:glycerophosphodiester phosphodiesterase [Emydomyces testavorans]|uniref:glycerophosphodiester phosphodiesterase n=1 Tax=Emydomyces testavorans TaxID=2070801 RepID=A0AAF0DMX9_9EURO|nr:glycerophosphodiester phosphodiesterase [Emydomyces testavorans]
MGTMRFATVTVWVLGVLGPAVAAPSQPANDYFHGPIRNIQVGVRPDYLVSLMDDSPLKRRLQFCSENPLRRTDFSISHRGAPLQFPEHTKEGLYAAARMGAGILECDVAFTKDRQLVCRHSQCDLHTTTNVLVVPELAKKCTTPFTPAADGKPANAKCCTSDFTLAEFKSLCGKMDSFVKTAKTPEEYQGGVPDWRTTLYSQKCGTLLAHKEYIQIIDSLGLKFTPELKTPEVQMPFEGNYTQEQYAQQLIDEYKAARIRPERVFTQSFLPDDIFYWLRHEPAFGKQAVYLDARVDTPDGYKQAIADMRDLAKKGVNILAPPIFALLATDAQNRIVPSEYAKAAKQAGIKLITWSLERSGPLKNVAKNKEYYYQSVLGAVMDDGDMYEVVDVLARQVGVLGMFADWPATVTYYANCFGL